MTNEKIIKSKKSSIAEAITPYISDSIPLKNLINNIVDGNNLKVLRLIPDNSINLIITSPPYFKQRDYGSGIGNEKNN